MANNRTNKLGSTLLLSTSIVFGVLMFAGCVKNDDEKSSLMQPAPPSAAAESQAVAEYGPPSDPNSVEEKWGIKIESARRSAGGYMIDFRYRVHDPEKAKLIINPKTRPYMIDEATGAKFAVPSPPKVGDLRNAKNIVAGKVYFIFFANPGNYVKSGQKITVCIGDLKIEHLTVL